jgi:hypothetical protein
MLEVEALDDFTNPITKKTTKTHDKFEIPYETNKVVLKKYGYKLIDEIISPEQRQKEYESKIPMSPTDYNNKITTDPKKRARYKELYDKWKASGWKNTSTAMVNPTQPKKVGTYNPSTGEIDFA